MSSRKYKLLKIIFDFLIINSIFFNLEVANKYFIFNLFSICILFNYIIGYYDFFDILSIKNFLKLLIKNFITIFIFFTSLFALFKIFNNEIYDLELSLIFKTFYSSILLQSFLNLLYFFKKKELWIYQNNTQLNEYINKNFDLLNSEIELKSINKIDSINFRKTKVAGVLCHNQVSKLKENIYKKENTKITFMSLMQLFEFYFRRTPPELIEKKDFFEHRYISNKNLYFFLKRICDLIFSIFLLIMTSPIIFLIGILIKIEDGGPIFYSQIRSGLHEKPYKIIKLRSMIVNAELNGPQWSFANDSRLTNIGKIIRALRLDELPQLLSVIKGDMSLVGPRPERPIFVDNLSKQIPNYKIRSILKPGLSGWAQVNYPYGSSHLDAENKLSYDIFYVKNISLPLDLLIFLKTIRIVFTAKGT